MAILSKLKIQFCHIFIFTHLKQKLYFRPKYIQVRFYSGGILKPINVWSQEAIERLIPIWWDSLKPDRKSSSSEERTWDHLPGRGSRGCRW